jgi:hypothetical protein
MIVFTVNIATSCELFLITPAFSDFSVTPINSNKTTFYYEYTLNTIKNSRLLLLIKTLIAGI